MIKDKKQWEKILAKANKGDAESQWLVGLHYDDGLATESDEIIVEQNFKKAFNWYSLAAEQGNISAQLNIGCLLSNGDGTKKDVQKAIYWTKKAINQGSFSAAHNLGTIYRDLQKPKLSFKWYSRAVQMGDPCSLLDVGLCHLFGYGVKQDFNLAQRAFKEIKNNDPTKTTIRTREDTLYWLSLINLLNLSNEKKSTKKARKYLEVANIDNDHEQANQILNLIGKTKNIKT